jgi:hypothetical protein
MARVSLVLALSACPGGEALEPTATGTGTTEPATTGGPTTTSTTAPTTGDGDHTATETSNTTGGGCVPADVRACYSGVDPETSDHAPCHPGTQKCGPDGVWGACEGEVVPAPEDCSTDEDEDCDGLGPGQDIDCACRAGAVEACTVEGALGVCAAGQRTCAMDGSWGVCASIAAPDPGKCALELPDQQDYDCDGYTSCGEYDWSVRFGGTDYDFGHGVVVDPVGDLWIAGAFSDTMDLGGSVLEAVDGLDAFVARLAPDGGHLWSHSYGSTRDQSAGRLRIDGDGDVIVSGGFNGPIDLGGGEFFVDWDFPSVFLAKFTPAGEHVWSTALTGTVNGSTMTLDSLGAPILTGGFRDGLSHGDQFVLSAGLDDIFLARDSPANGSTLLFQSYGDAKSQHGYDVAVDLEDNLVLTGYFEGTVDLGGAPLTVNAQVGDAYLASIDADGQHRWSRAFGGAGFDYGTGLAVAPGGDVLLTGVFETKIDLGGGPLSSAGDRDLFVARFTGDGEHVWSRRFGDAGTQQYIGVAVDARGDVVLYGAFEGAIDFGGGPLVSAGGNDVFMVKLDASGEHVWSRRAGDVADQFPADIAFDADGRVLVIGYFAGSLDFGGGPLSSAGFEDVFIARFLP